MEGAIAAKLLSAVLAQSRVKRLLSTEPFSVDGTLIEAWASMKSFRPRDGGEPPAQIGGRNREADFHGQKRSNATHASTTDREARLYRKGPGSDHYGGGEVGGELVVAGGDASPIFEAAEHAFDEIALAVGDLVKGMMPFAGRVVRDDRDSAALTQETTEPIAVIGRVGGQATARRNSADQNCRDADVAEMSRGYFDGDGASARIDDGVDFRGAAAARATNRLRLGPPFPPAAATARSG